MNVPDGKPNTKNADFIFCPFCFRLHHDCLINEDGETEILKCAICGELFRVELEWKYSTTKVEANGAVKIGDENE